MKRYTVDGCAVLDTEMHVRGVGRDPIGAWTEATFLTNDEHREDLIRRGWRCVPARVTVTFDPKSDWFTPGSKVGRSHGA
jgi:hypothetical protein